MKTIIQSVAIGLSLATLSLAHADTRTAPDAAKVAAQRAAFTKHLEVASLLSQVHQHPDIALLRSHQQMMMTAKGSHVRDEIEMGGDRRAPLVLSTGSMLQVRDGTGTRTLTPHDFDSLGITTKAALDHHLGEQVIKIAGTGGSASDPAAIEKARTSVQARVADAQKLQGLIMTPSQHADIAQLLAIKTSLRAYNRPDKPIELANNGKESLQIVEVRYNQTNRQPQVTQQIHVHSLETSMPSRQASLADLHRFGIVDSASFDAAVQHAMLSVPLEDLP